MPGSHRASLPASLVHVVSVRSGLSENEDICPQDTYAAPPPDAVGRLARTGAKWSVSLLITRQVIGLGSTAVICRLLAPDDFGLLAMVRTLTAFLMLASDMGMSWANVHKKDIQRNEVNVLFWSGAFFGGLAWGICALAAPLVADFYGRDELTPICLVLGASLLVNGLTMQPLALLKRQMRQKTFSLLQTISTVVAAIVAITLAFAGAGYWTLVAQVLTAALVLLVLSLQQSGYRPGIPKLSRGMVPLLTFGGYVGVKNLVTYFQLNLPNILIGRFCGAEELGYYSRAFFLRTLPAMYAAIALTDVMVPALTVLRGDRQRLGAAYQKAIRVISFVGCPLGAFLGVTAPETVRLIFGPAWGPVAPLLVWLAFPAVVLPVYTSEVWLFLAAGKARRMFLQTLVITPVVALAFSLALPWGTEGIAIVGAALFTIPIPLISLYLAHRAANIELTQTLKTIAPVLLACCLSAACGVVAGLAATSAGLPWGGLLAVKTLVMIFAYFLSATFLIRPLPVPWLEERLAAMSPGMKQR